MSEQRREKQTSKQNLSLGVEEAGKLSIEDVTKQHAIPSEGLSDEGAQKRLDTYGPNALEEKKVNPLLKFLSYFWGPIPWMIEVAAVLSALVRHWVDLIIIVVLLVFNAVVGFWQEYQAANAVEALKKTASPQGPGQTEWELARSGRYGAGPRGFYPFAFGRHYSGRKPSTRTG